VLAEEGARHRLEGVPAAVTVTNILLSLTGDLEATERAYGKLFESLVRVPYSTTVRRHQERLVTDRLLPVVAEACHGGALPTDSTHLDSSGLLRILQLCVDFRQFYRDARPGQDPMASWDRRALGLQAYFLPAFSTWLDMAQMRLVKRIERSFELDCCSDPEVPSSPLSYNVLFFFEYYNIICKVSGRNSLCVFITFHLHPSPPTSPPPHPPSSPLLPRPR
jgi:hypothetical protein